MKELLRALPAEFDARLRRIAERSGRVPRETRPDAFERPAVQPAEGAAGGRFRRRARPAVPDHVAAPPRAKPAGFAESTRAGSSSGSMMFSGGGACRSSSATCRVEEFTEPGDPLRLDYGYQNGVRGYLHAVALGRDPSQPKMLAYTARRIRARLPDCEFTAITEAEPASDNRRQQFVARLFADENIAMVSLSAHRPFRRGPSTSAAVKISGVGFSARPANPGQGAGRSPSTTANSSRPGRAWRSPQEPVVKFLGEIAARRIATKPDGKQCGPLPGKRHSTLSFSRFCRPPRPARSQKILSLGNLPCSRQGRLWNGLHPEQDHLASFPQSGRDRRPRKTSAAQAPR